MAETSIEAGSSDIFKADHKGAPRAGLKRRVQPAKVNPSENNDILLNANRERVSQSEVEIAAQKLQERFGLPAEIMERAGKTEAYVLEPEELSRELEAAYSEKLKFRREEKRKKEEQNMHLNRDEIGETETEFLDLLDQVEEEADMEMIDKYKQQAQTEAMNVGAVEITKLDGTQLILFNKTSMIELSRDEVLRHEILHALGSRGFSQGTGFTEGLDSGVLNHHPLNEAATEVLRIASQFPEISPKDMFTLVKEKKILVGYRQNVQLLLSVLAATHLKGGKPVSFADLSDFYFGIAEKKPSEISSSFFTHIEQSIPERHKDAVTQVRFKFNAF